MGAVRHKLIVPDLGLGGVDMTVSLWLVRPGREVSQADRVVEILAGDVTVDLPAPVSGVLTGVLVAEDEPVRVGQVLAEIAVDDSAAAVSRERKPE